MKKYYCNGKKDFCHKSEGKGVMCGDCKYADGTGGEEREVDDVALLPLSLKELHHLQNDLIAYIQRLEDRGCDKEEFGYFSRKELLAKLNEFEKANFPQFTACAQ